MSMKTIHLRPDHVEFLEEELQAILVMDTVPPQEQILIIEILKQLKGYAPKAIKERSY